MSGTPQNADFEGMTMTSREWLDALAAAWDAGFDAASDRATVAILGMAGGTKNAERLLRERGPARNPYRLNPPGSHSTTGGPE